MPRWAVWMVLALVLLRGAALAANLTFAWTAPTVNADGSTPVDVTGYRLYCRLPAGTYTECPSSTCVDVGNALTGTFPGLTASTLYYCGVRGYDATGNVGPLSQESGNLTGATIPSAPTFLRLAAMTCRDVRLRWNPSVDDLAVTEYRVRRGGVQIGTAAVGPKVYDDLTVAPNTGYTYTVRAADASANESSDSNSVVLTTPSCP